MPGVLLLGFIYFLIQIASYGLNFWAPDLIKTAGGGKRGCDRLPDRGALYLRRHQHDGHRAIVGCLGRAAEIRRGL